MLSFFLYPSHYVTGHADEWCRPFEILMLLLISEEADSILHQESIPAPVLWWDIKKENWGLIYSVHWFFLFFSFPFSSCHGGYAYIFFICICFFSYVTVFDLPARGQPHSVFRVCACLARVCLLLTLTNYRVFENLKAILWNLSLFRDFVSVLFPFWFNAQHLHRSNIMCLSLFAVILSHSKLKYK